MLLAIDIGNTKIAFGIFEGDKLRNTLQVATDIHRLTDEYASILLNLLSHHDIKWEEIKIKWESSVYKVGIGKVLYCWKIQSLLV